MPIVCRFQGVVIAMYFGDHPPSHIHVRYGEHDARIAFRTRELMSGTLPPRILRMVLGWCELRDTELERNWELAQSKSPLKQIEPLP